MGAFETSWKAGVMEFRATSNSCEGKYLEIFPFPTLTNSSRLQTRQQNWQTKHQHLPSAIVLVLRCKNKQLLDFLDKKIVSLNHTSPPRLLLFLLSSKHFTIRLPGQVEFRKKIQGILEWNKKVSKMDLVDLKTIRNGKTFPNATEVKKQKSKSC